VTTGQARGISRRSLTIQALNSQFPSLDAPHHLAQVQWASKKQGLIPSIRIIQNNDSTCARNRV